MSYGSSGSSRPARKHSNAESSTGSMALDHGLPSDSSVIDFADALDNSAYRTRHVPTSYVLPPTSDSSSSISSMQPRRHPGLGGTESISSFSTSNTGQEVYPLNTAPFAQSTSTIATTMSTNTLQNQQSFSEARRAMQMGRLRDEPSQSSLRLSRASSQSAGSSITPAPPPTAPLPVPPALLTPNGSSPVSNPPSRSVSRQPSRNVIPARQQSQQADTPESNSTPAHKFVTTPRLHGYNGEEISPALMHWTKLGTHGQTPTHGFRAHSVTLVEQTVWIFGGQDYSGCWDDVWCLDLVTLYWYHPPMQGDVPPPCRAHSATHINGQILVFGGGNGDKYYNHLYLLNTASYKWIKFDIRGESPPARRAHTAVLYGSSLWIYGGGTGSRALSDLWSLDVAPDPSEWEWICYRAKSALPGKSVRGNGNGNGKRERSRAPSNASEGGFEGRDTSTLRYLDGPWPSPRGYHTANVVNDSMVVLGGSDGGTSFDDLWLFDFKAMRWKEIVDRENVNPRPKLLAHTATQIGSYLFVVGGHDTKKYTDDVRLFNLAILLYETKVVAGLRPKPRAYHGSVHFDSRLFIFGGYDGTKEFSDVWYIDLAAQAYLDQVTDFTIDEDDGDYDDEEGTQGIPEEDGGVTPSVRRTLGYVI